KRRPAAQRALGEVVAAARATGPGVVAGGSRGHRGEHDRLEAVELGEGSRSALLGEEERGAALGVAHRGQGTVDAVVLTQVVDHGQAVVGEAVPVEVVADRRHRLAMTTQIRGVGVVAVGEVPGERTPDRSAEPGGVGQEEGRAVAAEVVEGHVDAAGRSDELHPPILAAAQPINPHAGSRRRSARSWKIRSMVAASRRWWPSRSTSARRSTGTMVTSWWWCGPTVD